MVPMIYSVRRAHRAVCTFAASSYSRAYPTTVAPVSLAPAQSSGPQHRIRHSRPQNSGSYNSPLSLLIGSNFAFSKRHASSHRRPTASSSSSSSSVSSSSTQHDSIADDINPPASTLPAPIELPESLPPSAAPSAKLKRLVSMGRAYVSFYKTGLKNVYYNFRKSVPLRKALGVNPYIPSTIPPSPPPLSSSSSSSSSETNPFESALKAARFTRSDFQLVRRAAYDFRRLIPFTLIVIICGEFTPLVVLALGSAVTPFTCRVPGQIRKTQKQRAERKRAAITAHLARTTGSVTPLPVGSERELDLLVGQFANANWVEQEASAEEVLRACAVFGLVKTHEWPAMLSSLGYRRRLRTHVEYLRLDDGLIVKHGGVKGMNPAEVRIAVEERGGVDVGDEKVQRAWLEKWLHRRKSIRQ